MTAPLGAIAIFIAVFAVATLRKVHLGVLMFPAACGVGVWLGGMPLRDVVGGFPVSLMVLVAGVTYFFGLAQINGTIDHLIGAVLYRAGGRPALLPFVFFALTGAIASMGSPLAGLVLAPVGMPLAKRSGVDSTLMALAINSGISAGAFAPTSLFGIVSYGTAHQAGIDINPLTLLVVAVASNLILLAVAALIFTSPGRAVREPSLDDERGRAILPWDGAIPARPSRVDLTQLVTLACMVGLVASVIGAALGGTDPDIGVIAFAFGAVLTLVDPMAGRAAVGRIDWSTVLLVGGIVTFVGVLQKVGAVDLLAQSSVRVGTPLLAAMAVCMIAGLASAFASTTGILAALVPLAVPLATSGAVAGWALISALGVCASIVDASPFSTTGATLIASAAAEDRPRLRFQLARWGMSMVAVGPIVLLPLLLLLGRLN